MQIPDLAHAKHAQWNQRFGGESERTLHQVGECLTAHGKRFLPRLRVDRAILGVTLRSRNADGVSREARLPSQHAALAS